MQMDYELFEKMTHEEAVEHLEHYLKIESRAIESILEVAATEGISLNYELESLSSVLEWFISKSCFTKVPVPKTEPDWIQKAHPEGLIEFSQDTKYLILRASYYMRQCFINAFEDAAWGLGKPGYMHKNMPVITGFDGQKELPPMVVCENLFSGILTKDKPISFIRSVVEWWISYTG